MAQTQEKPAAEEKMVTVFWHEARILTYAGHSYTKAEALGGLVRTKGADGKEYDPTAINRKKGFTDHGSVVQFQPGENVIPEALWEDMKKHETIANYIDNGKLELFDPTAVKGRTAPNTPGLADDLEAYSYKDCMKLIAETMNLEKLTKWRNNLNGKRDKAEQLKDALTAQITKLTAAG